MSHSESVTAIRRQLGQFESISLSEMDGVKLMNRTDVKFMIPLNRLATILTLVQEHYRILEINEKRSFRYETLYYDTQELGLYHQHQAGQLNRYKIRHRNYTDSDLAFFEVKFKNNKGRTIKKRIPKEDLPLRKLDFESSGFLKEISSLNPESLESVLWVGYTRITLVSKTNTERLTIDIDLTFANDTRNKNFPELAIAEVKQDKAGAPSVFLEIMHRQQIRAGAISKYCFGVISLFDQVKHNRFKPYLNSITKILNHYGIPPVGRHSQHN